MNLSIDRSTDPPAIGDILSLLGIVAGCLFLGYVPAQGDFHLILPSILVSFFAYGYIIHRIASFSLWHIAWVGLGIRFLLIFAFPQLSDDIYRFLWDGHLILEGKNPYSYLPSEIATGGLTDHMQALYTEMNSPEYYTIYPPLTQLIFYLANVVTTDDLYYSTMVIKLLFFGAEIATYFGIIAMLKHLVLDSRLVAIYFLNPLVITEGMGNLHFEVVMISFLIWGLYYVFVRRQMTLGAVLMALSIATKLLPLMFLPYFLFRMRGKERVRYFFVGFLSLALAFSPLAIGLDFANFWSSVDLYFQKFEFNASIYYISRAMGQLLAGYNLIYYLGPLLGITTLLAVLRFACKGSNFGILAFGSFAFCAFVTYLILATTVHPWYLCVPIMLSVFVRWRFVLIWSGLIMLTYINYSYLPYHENLWIVSIEYFVVLMVFLYEYRSYGHTRHVDLQRSSR